MRKKASKIAQRLTSLPNPFFTIDTFQPKRKDRWETNKTGSSELYTLDGEVVENVMGFVRPEKIYDGIRFTKVYKEGWIAMSTLSTSAMKVLLFIISQMDYTDTFDFNIDRCIKETGYKDKSHVYKAMSELTEKHFIAKTDEQRIYFINPLFLYRGDRLKLLKE